MSVLAWCLWVGTALPGTASATPNTPAGPTVGAAWTTFAPLSGHPAGPTLAGHTRLVVLRPASQAAAAPVDLFIDGRFHTSLLPGAFTDIERCAGPVQLAWQFSSGPRRTLTLAAEPSAPDGVIHLLLAPGPASEGGPAELALARLAPALADGLLASLRRQAHAVSRVTPQAQCLNAPTPQASAVAVAVPVPVAVPSSQPQPKAAEPVRSDAKPPPPAKPIVLSAEMLFTVGGSRPQHVSERGQAEILKLARQLKKDLQPGQQIRVEGHTDPSGSAALNRRLSLERAQTVQRILINSGLPASQVQAIGLGSSRLVVKNCGRLARHSAERAQCNRPNRRVEIIVLPTRR